MDTSIGLNLNSSCLDPSGKWLRGAGSVSPPFPSKSGILFLLTPGALRAIVKPVSRAFSGKNMV